MTLLSRTKDIVKKRGISMERLAKEIGISKSGIYQWDAHEPKPSTINKAADFLHVSVDYLMERTDDPSQYLSETERMTSNIDLKEAKNNGAILSWGGVDIDDDDMEIIKRILEGK